MTRGGWLYSIVQPGFERESSVLLGLKLVLSTGVHFGWIRFVRPVIDDHTQFIFDRASFQPVPDEPIPDGEPSPFPNIRTDAGVDGVSPSWDPR